MILNLQVRAEALKLLDVDIIYPILTVNGESNASSTKERGTTIMKKWDLWAYNDQNNNMTKGLHQLLKAEYCTFLFHSSTWCLKDQ